MRLASFSPLPGRPVWRVARLKLLAVLMAGVGLSARPSQALDFQLRTVETLDDGFKHEHSCFRYDDHSDMQIDLPRGWNTTADARSITSVSPDGSGAVIHLEKSALTPDTPFRDTGLDVYRRGVLSGLPEGAVNARIVAEKANPLPIFGWKDYEFTVTYNFFGRDLRRGVVFVNVNPKQQVLMTVSAEQGNFEQVHSQGLTLMQSWTPIPAS